VYANNFCGGCHTPDPANRVKNIAKGVTTAALDSSFTKVGEMIPFQFQTKLSATDKLNLAAYIKSRVSP
jgi:hypothetical protein